MELALGTFDKGRGRERILDSARAHERKEGHCCVGRRRKRLCSFFPSFFFLTFLNAFFCFVLSYVWIFRRSYISYILLSLCTFVPLFENSPVSGFPLNGERKRAGDVCRLSAFG